MVYAAGVFDADTYATATDDPPPSGAIDKLRLGANVVTGLRLGNATVNRLYLGSTLVWQPGGTAPPPDEEPEPGDLGIPTLPMNGFFYGIDGPQDSTTYSPYKYRLPVAVRFRAEITGSITSIRWSHRYNRSTAGELDGTAPYSNGNGGTIRLELRRNDPALQHPPGTGADDPFGPLAADDANLLGRTADTIEPTSFDERPTLALQAPVPVVAGELYWLVFHQLTDGAWVSIMQAQLKGWASGTTASQGGPYWLDSWHIARVGTAPATLEKSWTAENGTFVEEQRHLVRVQFLYKRADNTEIWSGWGTIFANGAASLGTPTSGTRRAFGVAAPIRMVFTPTRSSFMTKRLWFRAYRDENETTVPGNMRIRLFRGPTLLATWEGAPGLWVKSAVRDGSPIPAPIPFVALDLAAAVQVQQGQQHFLQFGSVSGSYLTHAQNNTPAFTCRNTFQDGYAQYSTDGGATFVDGWHMGSLTARKDCVLPFMLEVEPPA